LGHGGVSYFAVLKAEDERKLDKMTRKHLDEYIANAPTGSDTIPGMFSGSFKIFTNLFALVG
jgi:hypothetical protein